MRTAAGVDRARDVHDDILNGAARGPTGDEKKYSSEGRHLKINLPNALTLLRIFLVPFLVVVLLTKFDGRETVGLVIFLTAVATDFLDGWLARRRGEITTLGALLDPIADKLLISAAFISLVELGLAPAWMVVVVIGREFAVSGLRSIASGRGIVISASVWGKIKMGTQIAAVSLLILALRHEGFALPGRIALWAVVAVAIVSGTEYFTRFLRRIVLEGPRPGD
ncbi:MAG TPA: CDP-diacylglycerol--glycerol-3-phosphate 3-phosphatidyltransferase [Thermoanaerobaculia bacterium]|nr:CDP-diacylglycerol--glycerol-3-phosphate 3-phosphatidyltransferase [Thermoanaerobaculia bacterium]